MMIITKELPEDVKKFEKIYLELYELALNGKLNINEKERDALLIEMGRLKGHLNNMIL